MHEVGEEEARRLIVSGEAGYWSVRANPPIEHDDTTVVYVAGRFFVLPATLFSVRFIGAIGIMAGRMKGAHTIQLDDSIPIFGLIKEELARYGMPIVAGELKECDP